jgi:DNA-binding HxlR family transcriptional regulator
MVTKTAAFRNPIDRDCGSRRALALVGDRWTAVVVCALSRGTLRFGQLRRTIGISQKVLTDTLRGLERDGLVQRRVYAVVPPKVEYSLTELGTSLVEPLTALCHWADQHLVEVEAARGRFDGNF